MAPNGAGETDAEAAREGEARGVCDVEAAVLDAVEFEALVGVEEGEARCINFNALTRPLKLVTVADLPGGVETMIPLFLPLAGVVDGGKKIALGRVVGGGTLQFCLSDFGSRLSALIHTSQKSHQKKNKCRKTVVLEFIIIIIIIIITDKPIILTRIRPLNSCRIDQRQCSLRASNFSIVA